MIGGNGVPECVAKKVSPAEVKPGECYVVSDAVCSLFLSLNHVIVVMLYRLWIVYFLVTNTVTLCLMFRCSW